MTTLTDPTDVLADLTTIGVQIRRGGETGLILRPRSRCTPELVARVRAAKPQLVAFLTCRDELLIDARQVLRWRDDDVADFLTTDFAQAPAAAVTALRELLEFVRRTAE